MIYGHEMEKSLLRELISNYQVTEVPGTGRVYVESFSSEDMVELINQ